MLEIISKLTFITILFIQTTYVADQQRALIPPFGSIANFHFWDTTHLPPRVLPLKNGTFSIHTNANDDPLILTITNHVLRLPEFDPSTFLSTKSTQHIQEERTTLLKLLPRFLLDAPVLLSGASCGRILLHQNDSKNFQLWLDRGATCTAITHQDSLKKPCYTNTTILHELCVKGTDLFPDIDKLIHTVLLRNPNAISAKRGDGSTALALLLRNPYINDQTTFKIVQLFTDFIFKNPNLSTDEKNTMISQVLSELRAKYKQKSIHFLEKLQNESNKPQQPSEYS